MLHVGVFCLRHRVVVDINDVIEHSDSGPNGLAQLVAVKFTVLDVLGQVDGTQVTHRNLVGAGVEGDLGA